MADLTHGEDATDSQFCAEHLFVQPNTYHIYLCHVFYCLNYYKSYTIVLSYYLTVVLSYCLPVILSHCPKLFEIPIILLISVLLSKLNCPFVSSCYCRTGFNCEYLLIANCECFLSLKSIKRKH